MIGVRNPLPGVVYPLQRTLESYVSRGVLREETLVDALERTFGQHGNSPALAGPEGDYTYGELDEITDRLAAALLDLGLAPLDRALFQIGNCPELVIAFVACLKAGIIPICTIAAHRRLEIGAIGNHAAARAHFVQGDHKDDLVGFALGMQQGISSVEHIIVCRGEAPTGTSAMRHLIEGQSPTAARTRVRAIERDPFQVAVFQLSGGTTGVPKIIPRFHNEYLYNFEAVAATLDLVPGDSVYTAAPLIHNAGMVLMLGPALIRGCRVVISANTDVDSLISVLRDFKPTWFPIRGPLLERLRQGDVRRLLPLTHMKGVMSTNAARLTEELLEVRSLQFFGMTEGVIMLTPPQSSQSTRWTTVGCPISPWDEIRILQPGTELDVPVGEIGELAVRGPYTVRGYYDAPERDQTAFTSDGFYRSGDLMSALETDCGVCYQFRGRIKDVVDRAGEKISCQEVEEALRAHPDVTDAAVVPMPDPLYGERACAFLLLKTGRPAPDVRLIGEHLRRIGVAKFKWPERLEVVAEFPQTRVGKIDKEALKDLIRSMLVDEQIADGSRAESTSSAANRVAKE